MRRLSQWSRVFLGLAVFSLLGSMLTRFTGLEPGLMKPVASAAMLMTGVLALWSGAANTNSVKDAATAVVLVVLLGFTVEVVGLYTGLPFGRYAYTDQWA
ncbi:MAG: carotenoid biosynthesis protein, partial [Fimbriimonadaceae bacterium]|nr:carotenoid biosynthesis protein [Fimbriimonadaceae bacterium]